MATPRTGLLSRRRLLAAVPVLPIQQQTPQPRLALRETFAVEGRVGCGHICRTFHSPLSQTRSRQLPSSDALMALPRLNFGVVCSAGVGRSIKR